MPLPASSSGLSTRAPAGAAISPTVSVDQGAGRGFASPLPAAPATYADREAVIDLADQYEALAAAAAAAERRPADETALSSFTSFPLPSPPTAIAGSPLQGGGSNSPSTTAAVAAAAGASGSAGGQARLPHPRVDFGSTGNTALSGLSESLPRPDADDALSPSLLLSGGSPDNSLGLHASTFVGGASGSLRPPEPLLSDSGAALPHDLSPGGANHQYDNWDDEGGDAGALESRTPPHHRRPDDAPSASFDDGGSTSGLYEGLAAAAHEQQPWLQQLQYGGGGGAALGRNGLQPGEEEEDGGAFVSPAFYGGGAGGGALAHPDYSPGSFDNSDHSHEFVAQAQPQRDAGGRVAPAAPQSAPAPAARASDAVEDDDDDDEEMAALLSSAGFPGGIRGVPAPAAPATPVRSVAAAAATPSPMGVVEEGVVQIGAGGAGATPPGPPGAAAHAGGVAPSMLAGVGGPLGPGMSRPHTARGGAPAPARAPSSDTFYSSAEIQDIEDLE